MRLLLSLVQAGDAFWSMASYARICGFYALVALHQLCLLPWAISYQCLLFLSIVCHLWAKHPGYLSRLFLRTCWANRAPWFARLTLKPQSATMPCGDKTPASRCLGSFLQWIGRSGLPLLTMLVLPSKVFTQSIPSWSCLAWLRLPVLMAASC